VAALHLTLTLETEALDDALRDLELIARRLAGRHGAVFRDLDRRVAQLNEHGIEAETWDALRELESCRFVVVPPPEIVALLADARRLGVI
jgi:hypothetical protein